ncbi:MAG: type VI secretion system tip protein TssI/VgrG [Alphaproteobacteria bacterium]|nr:type VI secretion system tip protein TssI/VgrG [Alphaproteobacteria bacterium]
MLKEKLFTRFDCFLDDPDASEPQFEVVSADVIEALSTVYEIKLTLSSQDLNLIPRSFIKQSGRLILNFGHHKRYFHGIIGVFKQLHLSSTPNGDVISLYEARLYPQLWFLKFNKEYRIFQEKSTLDIVEQLLQENELLHVTFPTFHKTSALEHSDPIRKYCVQYGESDFDFISRLLEDRGFYYYFDHQAMKHTLKLAFTPHDHKTCHVVDTVEIRDTDFKGNDLNKILTYEISSHMQPEHHILMDYNYHMASLEMASHTHSVGDGGAIYNYPSGFSHLPDGHTKAKHLVEGDEADVITLAGTSAAPFFSPGFKFTLSGHQNPKFDEKVFTLETVTHSIKDPRFASDDDLVYTNTFTAFLSTAFYRPELKTPKPKIHGTQTAIVVAPHGEEVWTDEQGRVKVQFHWNHRGYRTPIILDNAEEHHHKSHHKKHKHHLVSDDVSEDSNYVSVMISEEE